MDSNFELADTSLNASFVDYNNTEQIPLNGTYTAPSNGFLAMCGYGSGDVYIRFTIGEFTIAEQTPHGGNRIHICLPVKKGDTVTISSSISTVECRVFIPIG